MLNGDEIFIADSYGCYLFDCNTLKLKKKLSFKNRIHNLTNVFVSQTGEIFLLTGIDGVVYRITDFDNNPVPIRSVSTSLISQMIQYKTLVLGGNNTGIVKFDGNGFELLKSTP